MAGFFWCKSHRFTRPHVPSYSPELKCVCTWSYLSHFLCPTVIAGDPPTFMTLQTIISQSLPLHFVGGRKLLHQGLYNVVHICIC